MQADVFNATITALLRNGRREEAQGLYPLISQHQIKTELKAMLFTGKSDFQKVQVRLARRSVFRFVSRPHR